MPPTNRIERFLEFCIHRHMKAGQLLLRPGDPADRLYYLVQGTLVVQTTDGEHDMILAYLNDGDFVGEMGVFFEEQPARSVTVRARTECEIAEISYARLRGLAQGELQPVYCNILHALGRQLSERLLYARRKMHDLAFTDVACRVEHALQDLAQAPSAERVDAGIKFIITRIELGRIVGCSRETAGRVLKDMEKRGRIRTDGKSIILMDAETVEPA